MFMAALSLSWAGSAPADDAPMLTVTPADILMGASYNGATLKIAGRVPAGSEVVLRFIGAASELHMREKDKVLGLLWMNRNSLTFKNVPNVLLVQESKPLDQLGPAAKPYGLDSLRRMVQVEEASAGDDCLDAPAELLRLKKREGLCRESMGGVSFGPETNGTKTFVAVMSVPPTLSPGQYEVEMVAFKDGKIVKRATVPVTAKLVGLPAWLNNLAFKHSMFYGILATVIAILSGLLIGLVFQGRGGAH